MASPKVVIITGASSGIGRSCAIKMSVEGWQVVLTARREAELMETAELCSGETLVVVGDVTKEEDVRLLFETTVKRFGRLDMLFNNAGTAEAPVRLECVSLDGFNTVMNVNVNASFLCSREAFKLFLKQDPQGGRIVNNGSIAAHAPRPWYSSYTISKHAITGLTRSIAMDGRPHNITATQLDTGSVVTQLSAHSRTGTLQADLSSKPEVQLDPVHVANALAHIGTFPNDVTILEYMVLATGAPFVGRG